MGVEGIRGDARTVRLGRRFGAVLLASHLLYTTVGYYLLVDTDDDNEADYFVDISSAEDWSVNVYDVDAAFNHQIGSGVAQGKVVLVRVPLKLLGDQVQVGVQASALYEDSSCPGFESQPAHHYSRVSRPGYLVSATACAL